MSREKRKEFRVRLLSDDLASLVMEKHFCDNYHTEEGLENLLKMTGEYLSVDDIFNIAQEITDNTNPDNEWLRSYEPFDEITCYLLDLCHPVIAINSGRVNRKMIPDFNNWHPVGLTELDNTKMLTIGDYTILHNETNTITPYVAAYKYHLDTHDWEQGHYCATLNGAIKCAVDHSPEL